MVQILLKKSDLRRETFRAGGKGGQHQNVTESAVRYVHIPTGIRAESRSERSQFQNDRDAMSLLISKLYRHYTGRLEAERSAAYEAKPDATFGNKIRTYWLCGQRRVVDHRTGIEGDTDLVVKRGVIDDFIRADLQQR